MHRPVERFAVNVPAALARPSAVAASAAAPPWRAALLLAAVGALLGLLAPGM